MARIIIEKNSKVGSQEKCERMEIQTKTPLSTKTSLRRLSFTLCLILILIRGFKRLIHSDLWAEDGLFVMGALNEGLKSLATTVDGSYHTIQRFIALFTVHLLGANFISWVPFVICLVCILVLAAVASSITREDYAWLIPSQHARLLLALLYCLAPGLNEMTGNLCNINWSLFFWLALVGLKHPNNKWTVGDALVILIGITSTGTFPLLIPLFCWRIWVNRQTPRRGEIFLTFLMFLSLFWLTIHKGDRPPQPENLEVLNVLRFYISHLISYVGIHPWGGENLGFSLVRDKHSLAFSVVGILLFTFLIVWAAHSRKSLRAQVLTLFLGGTTLWVVLCAVARPLAYVVFNGQYLNRNFMQHRYSFASSIAAMIFWLGLVHPPSDLFTKWQILLSSGRSFFIFFLLLASVGSVVPRFRIDSYGPDRLWFITSEQLRTAMKKGCSEPIHVRTYPAPWGYVYNPGICKK